MEEENVEQEILLEPEYAVISPVTSVNGKIGDVVLTTSDLENDSDYQTGTEVQTAIDTAIAGKQDTLTAGNGININAQNIISVDTTIVATQQNLANEVTNRENADNALQSQIDAISASSDVVDIVGTYAELQAYDTQHLKDNDIIKVLQDETQGDATTYYRWSTTTQTFTLIGQEGPYYTKASADAQFVPQTRTVNGKPLSANITLNASDVSALGPSDVDTQLANSTNPVQNKVLYGLLGTMPSDFFSGSATSTSEKGVTITITDAIGLAGLRLFGDTSQTGIPTPDSPIPIDVVTGAQTVTVDDGGSNSQTYTIQLGTIELCKIGDYQDYIYKSGGDWYVHKEIRKRTLDGTETWTTGMVSSNRFFGLDTGDGVFNNTSGNIVFSDKFYNRFGSDNNSIMLSANSSTPGRMLVFINGIATTAADWKTWLSNNNTLVYYPVTTPTDTKITDQTLIDGLNSALNMTCYDETNVVVTSTNLAGALELTAVNANAKGLIYKARQ